MAGCAQGHSYRCLCAILQPPRQHQVGQVAAGHQQHTARSHQQQLQPVLILIAHRRDPGIARRQVQGVLLPELLLSRLHIGHVAGQPIVEFHSEFGFELGRTYPRPHTAQQVEKVSVWPFEACVAPSMMSSEVKGSQKSGMLPPPSRAP